MPGTSSSEESVPPRPKASAKHENLTAFEAALIDQIGERDASQSARDAEMLSEFRGMRKDIGGMFRAGGIGTLVVILFLISGVFLLRGVDPQQAAGATRTVVEAGGITTTVESGKKAEPVVGGMEGEE